MPEGLPGDQPQICASSGYDEAVIQSDPVNARSYHSTERRQKARRMRRRHRTADTGDLRGVAATPTVPAWIWPLPNLPHRQNWRRLRFPPPRSFPATRPGMRP